MDLTQISLGVALLVVSSLTFVGPAVVESPVLVYALTGATLVVSAGALLVGVANGDRPANK
ncbi:hypothetical protein ACFO5R_19660 [Halosolutus amylolyticus]|uniref:Uncharacterized protein n=1 Tax=Halosolutus amylolyticus TaxID=2932267 RepID=A0ABD5PUL9_9EURY|nr:hypothetical protein [Halosolutus amylolyticus]